jgi:glycosyltransferase involved in cell wall biosynthesis
MKIHILFKFKNSPTGGGNQFLRSLKKHLQSISAYEDDIKKADIVLFNSHQHAVETAKIKTKYPNKFFVHRIDGPMRLYNKTSDRRDDIVAVSNKYIADATIFQSIWSRQQNHTSGLIPKEFETVICNAPDASNFNHKDKKDFSTDRKVRLIATSWSKNWNKGFKIYQWMDQNLDFNRFEMKFVGNSPVEFKNVEKIPPIDSKGVAEKLKECDVFIFASPIEACSNSLLEALHCGLPVVGVNGSSNPEIIGKGGEVFDQPDDIPALLEKITNNYKGYQANINNPSIEDVGKKYYDFITHSYGQSGLPERKHGSFGWLGYVKFRMLVSYYRLAGRLCRLMEVS